VLLRFTVENFLSFETEVSLSMVANSDDRLSDHVITLTDPKQRRVLRSAAIYGANGHGKTNLVHAMRFIQQLIIKGSEVDKNIAVRNFRTNDLNSKLSTFVFNINIDGTEYEYGIRINSTIVAEEWLYYSPKGREVKVFERITEKDSAGDYKTRVDPGSPLTRGKRVGGKPAKEFFEFIAWGTRANQPFLTEAVERNSDALKIVYDWFKKNLIIVRADGEYRSLEIRAHKDTNFIEKISAAIRGAGIGIDRVQTEVRKLDFDDLKGVPQEIVNEVSEKLEPNKIATISGGDTKRIIISKNNDGDLELIDLIFIHKREDGTEVKFNQDEESAGTRRLLHLFPMIFDLLGSNKTYVVDEIDRKLHPILAYKMMKNFYEICGKGQLIFTTHNTHLLDLELMRRDEIWFVEKNQAGHSDLYSLSDLKVRPDVEIKKGYLNGRFGAIPFLGNISDLGWGKKGDIESVVTE